MSVKNYVKVMKYGHIWNKMLCPALLKRCWNKRTAVQLWSQDSTGKGKMRISELFKGLVFYFRLGLVILLWQSFCNIFGTFFLEEILQSGNIFLSIRIQFLWKYFYAFKFNNIFLFLFSMIFVFSLIYDGQHVQKTS